MRIVEENLIIDEIRNLFISANTVISCDITDALTKEVDKQKDELSRSVVEIILKNNEIAKKDNMPICQDTGMAIVFIKLGNEVHINTQSSLLEIVNEGVRKAYKEGYLRMSVVADPLKRVNTGDNTPAIVYTEIVPGDKIEITALPKGFGSENMSAIKMFNPTATKEEIIDFIVGVVKNAGAKPCPPIIVGVGIGGSFDYCALLSKKALARSVDSSHHDLFYKDMEDEALRKINELGIGVQGLGGPTTALKVNIETYPTHIAGLPVAVNISCHVTRHKTVII